jgi:hypothetical protein
MFFIFLLFFVKKLQTFRNAKATHFAYMQKSNNHLAKLANAVIKIKPQISMEILHESGIFLVISISTHSNN